jgi:VIT1/CCC1 family predicted Fe2+/Mn2+ transporter
MNILIWVLQGLLGFVFLMAGGMKLAQSREKVIASGGKWAEGFSGSAVKLIGAGEVLCAVGIVLPKLLGMEQMAYLSCASAVGIMVFMAGAFYTHLKRKEPPFLAVTAVFLLMALTVAWLNCPGRAA